jgi:hypothetical protein
MVPRLSPIFFPTLEIFYVTCANAAVGACYNSQDVVCRQLSCRLAKLVEEGDQRRPFRSCGGDHVGSGTREM